MAAAPQSKDVENSFRIVWLPRARCSITIRRLRSDTIAGTRVLARHQDRCRFSFIRAARRSCYVKSNLAVVDDASAATTLRTLFFAVFVPADLSFRVRAAFFAAELRFVGMGIPLMT